MHPWPNERVMLFHVTLAGLIKWPNERVMLFHVTLAGLIKENYDAELVRGPACGWLATHLKMGSPRYLAKLVCFAIQR
jgi:hypothetical protein